MKMHLLTVAPALALAIAGASALAVTPGPELRMTCHEMENGMPSYDPTFYEVDGADLYHREGDTRVRISTAGKPLFLNRVQDDDGPTDIFAIHVRNGHILTRTIYWQRPGRKNQVRFQAIYDFHAQTITDPQEPGDSCYHDAFKTK